MTTEGELNERHRSSEAMSRVLSKWLNNRDYFCRFFIQPAQLALT